MAVLAMSMAIVYRLPMRSAQYPPEGCAEISPSLQ